MGTMLEIELTDEEAARFEALAHSRNMSLVELLESHLIQESLIFAAMKRSFETRDDLDRSEVARMAGRSIESGDRPKRQVELLAKLLYLMDQSELLRRMIAENAEPTMAQRSRTETISERIMDHKAELYRRLAK
jgi:hypothetical protein